MSLATSTPNAVEAENIIPAGGKTLVTAEPYTTAGESFGKWRIDFGNTYWTAIGGVGYENDPILSIGINTNAIGSVIDDETKLAFAWKIEANYIEGAKRIVESYWQFRGNNGTVIYRPLHWVHDDIANNSWMGFTAELHQFYIPSKTVPGDDARTLIFQVQAGLAYVAGSPSGQSVFQARAGAGQAGALYLGYNEVNDFLIIRPSSANQVNFTLSGGAQFYFRNTISGIANMPALYIGATVPGSAHLTVTPLHDSVGGLEIVARATQAAHLSMWKVGGVNKLVINKNAYLCLMTNAAEADANIYAGQATLWFDSTNGAGKLMVKAKTADGTVVTGSVALT